MQMITLKETIGLIDLINTFTERTEQQIGSVRNSYAAESQKLSAKYSRQLRMIEEEYTNKSFAIRHKSERTINESKKILAELNAMDQKLESTDKYYLKTKRKKEASLTDVTSKKYADATDYTEAFDSIQKTYSVLYKKYSEYILPGIINGLNYFFSSQRKKDYEDLIVLRNTVASFSEEIERELPQIMDEQLATYRSQYFSKKKLIDAAYQKEKAALDDQYTGLFNKTADAVLNALDIALPESQAADIGKLIADYERSYSNVNNGNPLYDSVLNIFFMNYPVEWFVHDKVLISLLEERCSKFMPEPGKIRFPLVNSTADSPAWMIKRNSKNSYESLNVTHSLLYGMLTSVPVGDLTFIVVDPEIRGNSIAPFVSAKKQLPDLFDEKIHVSTDDIYEKLVKINEKIENILLDHLGDQYDTDFDYAKENPDYHVKVEVLAIYDFPVGFDERTLAELRNILRNGSRCGIYTVIVCAVPAENTRSDQTREMVKPIQELCSVIVEENNQLSFKGLPLSYLPMPQKNEFNQYFSRYMLIYEGIKNRGIAFSPLIKRLLEEKQIPELENHIRHLSGMQSQYSERYARVPDPELKFPNRMMLGNVIYPADIFSGSAAYKQITEKFRAENSSDKKRDYVSLPLTFDLNGNFNLMLNCTEATAKEMRLLTHHMIWNWLSFLPVTKANICVFDPEQRSNSITPFLSFRQRLPLVFDEKVYTDNNAMEERLKGLNSHIDEFIQEKLGNKYSDIIDFNRNTPSRAESLTLLIIYDFPTGMSSHAYDYLASILKNGNRCGIFTVLCYNPDIKVSSYDNTDSKIEEMKKYCTCLEYRSNSYRLLPYNLQVNIPKAVDDADAAEFFDEYVSVSEVIQKRGLSFRDILSEKLFTMDSGKNLSIPIGIGDGDSIVNMTFGEGSSHHGLIAGATGGGKSTLLHTLIMSCLLNYSPDQLNLYLMDFKSGTEFKIYESVRLPHIKLLAIDAMQEFGESILENLVAVMEDRGREFKEAGQTSLRGYRQSTGKTMPRILVIMDEFQILFNDATNRKVANHCAELTKRLVTEGRAFGIHLIMATQATKVISDLTLSTGTIEQMRIRVGLKCNDADARYIFGDDNERKALELMKGPIGTAVLNQDYTEKPNIGFRVAYCDSKTQHEFLKLISQKFTDYPYELQAFEGGRTTGLLEYFGNRGIGFTDELPVRIHMGDKIKVAPPFEIIIDRKRKHNLLICGSNERMANMITHDYILSALLNKNSSVYCIDGDVMVGDDASHDYHVLFERLFTRFHMAWERADIIRLINEIYDEFTSRRRHNEGDVIFVVIKNLQFLDLIRQMLKGETVDESEWNDDMDETIDSNDPFAALDTLFDEDDNDNSVPVGQKLLKLITDGSGFGIHFVVTSLEYQTVRESMFYGENVLSRFPERIIFSLGENDADNLIDGVSVSGLRDNTVYFTDGVKNTFQLKPYIMPAAVELNEYINAHME